MISKRSNKRSSRGSAKGAAEKQQRSSRGGNGRSRDQQRSSKGAAKVALVRGPETKSFSALEQDRFVDQESGAAPRDWIVLFKLYILGI